MLPIEKVNQLVSAGKRFVEIGGFAHEVNPSGARLMVKTVAGHIMTRPLGVPGRAEMESWADSGLVQATMKMAMDAFIGPCIKGLMEEGAGMAEDIARKLAAQAWDKVSQYEVKAVASSSGASISVGEKPKEKTKEK